MNGPEQLNPDMWVDEHGDALLRYAIMRVGTVSGAEDLVQETFLAALRGQESFRGGASERTWLIGILRHKITDRFRQHGRQRDYEEAEAAKESEEQFFDRTPTAHWLEAPKRWSTDPRDSVARNEFWSVLRRCVGKLKPTQQRAFVLREFDGDDTDAICNILGVSTTNLRVMLHRARLSLRACLDMNWFDRDTGTGEQ